MDKKKENISKEAIVAEYLTGTISYRGLEAKYGIPSRSICDWVLEYQGRKPSWKEKKRRKLEKEGKIVDIQICPRCKSARVKRVLTMDGDMASHLTITPIKYECKDCGWRERLVLNATNRLLGLKEMALIAEVLDLKEPKE